LPNASGLSYLQKITLTQFRNFEKKAFDFEGPVTGITGLNGAGKTNLLDAIYYLCYTKSYFQSREINNVQKGKEGFRVSGAFTGGPKGPEEISCLWREGKKSIEHNQTPYDRVTEHIGKYAAVMIAPDDIELINDGSELRRKFMDGLLSQSNSNYLEHLLLYQKYLAQRNAYLKQAPPAHKAQDLLDVYDEQLAKHGAYLISERIKLSAVMPGWVQAYYAALSSGSEQVGLLYKPSANPDQLLLTLKQARSRDLDYRRTLYGPHMEDWLFTLDSQVMKTQASQGQKKSFLISLKLAHIKWLQQLDKKPFLLLDDIFEKLDKTRLMRLFDMLQQFSLSQIFMTHTDEHDLMQTVKSYYNDLQLIRL
jgi:DNA replication and repair protein RecF